MQTLDDIAYSIYLETATEEEIKLYEKETFITDYHRKVNIGYLNYFYNKADIYIFNKRVEKINKIKERICTKKTLYQKISE